MHQTFTVLFEKFPGLARHALIRERKENKAKAGTFSHRQISSFTRRIVFMLANLFMHGSLQKFMAHSRMFSMAHDTLSHGSLQNVNGS